MERTTTIVCFISANFFRHFHGLFTDKNPIRNYHNEGFRSLTSPI